METNQYNNIDIWYRKYELLQKAHGPQLSGSVLVYCIGKTAALSGYVHKIRMVRGYSYSYWKV